MRKLTPLLVLLPIALACMLPGMITPSPTQVANPADQALLQTIIVETVSIAQTQTSAAQPPTLTPTLTREPSSTLIAEPSTATPFFIITVTVPVETVDPTYAAAAGIPGSVSGSGGSGDKIKFTGRPWTCTVRGVNPPRGGVVQADKEFYVTWTVLNTGTKNWTTTTIDFIYKSGYRHEGKSIQDLAKNVPSGGKINLRVLFKAPKVPGEYAANWMLRVGNFSFCEMRVTFEVRK